MGQGVQGRGRVASILNWWPTVGGILLGIYLAGLLGCTTVRKEYSFSVRPIDPPVQAPSEINCVQLGYDGLACEDRGIKI